METAGVSVEAVAKRFVEAGNRRDAEALAAVCHRDLEFHPTPLVGDRRVYRGHDGLRRWVADLDFYGVPHTARAREIRLLPDGRFVMVADVLLEGEVVGPWCLVGRVVDGKIIQAHSYLSDQKLLAWLGVVA